MPDELTAREIAPGVEMDAEHAFGRPRIAGRGIATAVVADRFMAGESVVALAADYHARHREIENAIRYELGKTRKQRAAEREMMRHGK